jgi:hypothetical protein
MSRKDKSRQTTVDEGWYPKPTEARKAFEETEFEKPRGISHVEVREGFVRVNVPEIPGELHRERLAILKRVRDAVVSIDFLKFTPTGMVFLAPETQANAVEQAFGGTDIEYSLSRDRSVVTIESVNMRDEEGLIARLVAEAITSPGLVEHLGDMHDRLLIVTEKSAAHELKKRLEKKFQAVPS